MKQMSLDIPFIRKVKKNRKGPCKPDHGIVLDYFQELNIESAIPFITVEKVKGIVRE